MSKSGISFELLKNMIAGGIDQIYITEKDFNKMDIVKLSELFERYDVKYIRLSSGKIRIKYL